MNKDELKHKLRSAHVAHEQVASLCDHLQELRSLAMKVTPKYGPQAGGSGDGQKLAASVADINEQEARISEKIKQLCAALEEVRALINLLPQERPEKTVMYMRYLNYRSWVQIAAELGYSWQHVHRLHGQGLSYILSKVNRQEEINHDK